MSKERLLYPIQVAARVLESPNPVLEENGEFTIQLTYFQKIHFRYEEKSNLVYIYMPILGEQAEQALFCRQKEIFYLLEETPHQVQTEVGTFGYDPFLEQIIFYNRLFLSDVNEVYLSMYLPLFIEAASSFTGVAEREVKEISKKSKLLVSVLSVENI
jgi:hypothetical protein